MNRRLKSVWKKIVGLRETTLLKGLRPEDRDLIARIRARKLTYLGAKKLIRLVNTCRAIEEDGLPGIIVEAGCALGGSSILMASLKKPERALFVYDVFEMIPPPTEEDTPDVHARYKTIVAGQSTGIGGDTYYGYQAHLYETVQNNFMSFGIDREKQNVSLIKGMVQDTLKIDQPVALAHIDVDWYDPVMTCLQRISPHLVIGGSIILDDYCSWGGCKKATDTFLENTQDRYAKDDSAGSMKLTKLKN